MPVSIGTIIQASYYNSLQSIIAGILGPSGYNLTLTSSQLSAGALVSAAHWNNLRTDLNVIQNIQAGSPFSSAALPAIVVGTIIYAATINLYDSAVSTVQAGYAGNLILVNNAFSDTRSSAWTAQIDDEVTISFASAAAAGNFFTTNGEVRLTLSQTTNANTTDSAWLNNLISVGTIVMNKNTTTRTGTGGTPVALGWNGLTTTYQTIYSGVNLVASSYYSNDSVYVYAKLTSAGDGVTIRTLLVNGGSGTVSSSTKATWGYKKAVAAGTPAFAFVAPNNFDDNAVSSGGGSGLPTITTIASYFAATPYTGNASTQTITTGVNLADSTSGLLWLKCRNTAYQHWLQSPIQIATGLGNNTLDTSNTGYYAPAIEGFTSTGFNLGITAGNSGSANTLNAPFIAWSFRRAQKFFDVVTWTGNGVGARNIPHGLGITPGMIIVKSMTDVQDWMVWHASLPATTTLRLNTTANYVADSTIQGVTSTQFATSASNGTTLNNVSGHVYVAYVFANDTSASGYIQTGAITAAGSQTVTLGWEPQYVMIKGAAGPDDWHILDATRGFASSGTNKELLANSTAADANTASIVSTPTGFTLTAASGAYVPYVWVAIRKNDPVQAPIFGAIQRTGDNVAASLNYGFQPDLAIALQRSDAGSVMWVDSVRGVTQGISTTNASGQVTYPNMISNFNSTGITLGNDNFSASWNTSGSQNTILAFKQSTNAFALQAYTGTSSSLTLTTGWTTPPEMVILKSTSSTGDWVMYHKNTSSLWTLNSESASYPTASIYMTISGNNVTLNGGGLFTNNSGSNYMAYMFGTKAGVSKVGSYTGTGTALTIDCGFTTGARFVLIKDISSSSGANGYWHVFDYADGMTSSAAYLTRLNINTSSYGPPPIRTNGSNGFTVTADGSGFTNVAGHTYLFLAFA